MIQQQKHHYGFIAKDKKWTREALEDSRELTLAQSYNLAQGNISAQNWGNVQIICSLGQ